MFLAAAEVVSAAGYGSVAILMKRLGVSYPRAAELIEALQDERILARDYDPDDRVELLSFHSVS